jgi:hypothetical protein
MLAELENKKKTLITNLNEVISAKLLTENDEELLKLTSQEIEIKDIIKSLQQQVKESETSLKKTIIKICNSFTHDLIVRYSKYLLSVSSAFKYDLKNYVYTKTGIISEIPVTELNTIFYVFDRLNQIKEFVSYSVFRLNTTYLSKRNFITSKKKKSRFRFRKLFKKIRSLRKIKKVFIFKKFKKIKSINFSFNFFNIFIQTNNIHNNNLFKRIPLSKRIVSRNNLQIFYKLHRKTNLKIKDLLLSRNFSSIKPLKKRFKIFLRNFHQKPY